MLSPYTLLVVLRNLSNSQIRTDIKKAHDLTFSTAAMFKQSLVVIFLKGSPWLVDQVFYPNGSGVLSRWGKMKCKCQILIRIILSECSISSFYTDVLPDMSGIHLEMICLIYMTLLGHTVLNVYPPHTHRSPVLAGGYPSYRDIQNISFVT